MLLMSNALSKTQELTSTETTGILSLKVITLWMSAVRLIEGLMLSLSQKLELWEISLLSIKMRSSLWWISTLLETSLSSLSTVIYQMIWWRRDHSSIKYSAKSLMNLNFQKESKLVLPLKQWASKLVEMRVTGLLTTWASLLVRLSLVNKVISTVISYQRVWPIQERLLTKTGCGLSKSLKRLEIKFLFNLSDMLSLLLRQRKFHSTKDQAWPSTLQEKPCWDWT